MKKTYDVIIVGAGPAGLACAEELKNSRFSVLLLEKNTAIGPKVCAGGLTRLDAEFDLPKNKSRAFKTQHIYVNDKEYQLQLAYPLKTISRADLGQYQLAKLNDATNIDILTNTPVLEIHSDYILTKNQRFGFQYLIGADGSNSMVRKYLKLPFSQNMGLYYDLNHIGDRFEWHVNTKAWGSAYLWVFPHLKHTNIGFHFNPRQISGAKAKKILDQFLIDNNYAFQKAHFHSAPLNYDYQGYAFGSVYLLGDAAGLVSKATGEGISMALTSGKEIARKILNPNYSCSTLHHHIKIMQRHTKMINRFDKYPRLQIAFFWLFLRLMKSKQFQTYFGN